MKIMLDECIQAKRLRSKFIGDTSYDVYTSANLGYENGTDDRVLVAGTIDHDCFLLTKDFRTITEKAYPPCTHGGILRIPKNTASPDYVFDRLKALRSLNLEHRAKGHFTYLEDDGIKIVTHKEVIERKFRDYDDLKDI